MKVCHRGHSGWWRVWALAGLLACGVGVGSGCAARQQPAAEDYSGQAKYAYEEALEALKASDYLEALKKFNFVRTKFPYSKYAALASLRIGDTYFDQEQWADAVASYRRFIQLHPTHPELPYAQYRIGLAFYEQLPSEWGFILPPAYERDLASTEDAERECSRFLEQYPNSEYSEEIAEKLREVRQRLADHEFYAATFYLERDRPRAAAMRLSGLLERFPGLGFDEEAMFLLGKAFLLLRDVGQAVGVWQRLIAQYPDHSLSAEAERYIARYGLSGAQPVEVAPEEAPVQPLQVKPPEESEAVEGDEEVEDEAFKLKLGKPGGGLKLEEPEPGPEPGGEAP